MYGGSMKYSYSVEVTHDGLNRYRIVKGQTISEAHAKARALAKQWDEQWERKCEAERRRKERADAQLQREKTKLEHEANATEAERLTFEAEQLQLQLSSIIHNTLRMNPITWDAFYDKSHFLEEAPSKPKAEELLSLPLRSHSRYNPKLTFFQKLSKKKKANIKQTYDNIYQKEKQHIEKSNLSITQSNNYAMKRYQESYEEWVRKKDEFYQIQRSFNDEINAYKEAFEHGDSDAIAFFYDEMITVVKDPFDFDRQVEAYYLQDTKTLLLDMYFPVVEELPNTKKVTYIKSRGEFKESYHIASYMNQKYDDVIYQTILQTLYLVFEHDKNHDFIDSIVINGKVNTVDKATGCFISPYILSVSVKKSDFERLNLEHIDAKAWFKTSKGVSAAKIANITPVAPILILDKDDKRFVEGYGVIDEMDKSVNLASMDWQDFENLIRELFHEEFNINGGEVKITQTSRDGGVDAVAFDPDPIRGGKIVIQAKRYTNVVGVSAVRDLYGTVLNEGAMKGILITTSNYGNDAYKFAQGKPLRNH
jgi:restriction system protein